MTRFRIHGAQMVLGLLLSLTLWTYVSFATNPNASRMIVVPVQDVSLGEGLVIVNAETGLQEAFKASTTLTVTGPYDQLQGLGPGDFHATASLAGLGPGVSQVEVRVTAPRGARVVGTNPDQITVRLARQSTATVPVRIKVQGSPPFSFNAGQMTVGARESVVRGPEDLVRRVVAASGQVDLQGQTSDISQTLSLRPVDSAGGTIDGVTLEPPRVSVQVPITTEVQVGVQQVSVVPDPRGQPAPGYAVGSIDWDPKIIEVFTSSVITGPVHTEPISLTGLSASITRTVGLERLQNVITRPATVRVTVRVSIVPISVPSQLPLLVPISSTGLGPGLTASAQPAAVQVTLAGPFDRLSRLTSAEVSATVDLAGLGPGTYSLPVRINAPTGLQTLNSTEPRVRVTLQLVATPSPVATASPSPSPPTPTP